MILKSLLASVLSLTLLGAGLKTEPALTGIWTRKSDGLTIEVKEIGKEKYIAQIVQDGVEKFPCDVSGQPIYKNIEGKNNFWSCEFLVVEINRCKSDYETGSIRITKKGEMEVNCSGFGKKYYTKKLPRYYQENEKISR